MTQSPAWLQSLDLSGLIARHGVAAVACSLGHGFAYLHGPAMRPDGAVFASMLDPRAPNGPELALHVAETAPFAGPRSRGCDCATVDFCPHLLALLTDLAIAPSLRDAVARGQPVDSVIAALPGLRAAAHRVFAAEQLAARWLPVRPVIALPAPDIALVLPTSETDQALQARAIGGDGPAGFELRLRLPGQRTLVDPTEVSDMAFPPEDRRILRLCARASGKRKGWRVTGTDASVVLHLLSLRGRAVVLEGTGEPLAFSDGLVQIAVTPAVLPRGRVSLSLASLRSELRPVYGVRHGQWEEAPPAQSAPVTALEARWSTGDEVVAPARDAVLFRGPYPYLWVPLRRTLFPVDPCVDIDAAWHLQARPAMELADGHGPTVFRVLRGALRGRGVGLPPPEALGVTVDAPTFALRLEGRALGVHARLEARYRRGTVAVVPRSPTAAHEPWRDRDAESMAVARVVAAGLPWDPGRSVFTALDDAAAWFWTRGVPMLRGEGTPTIGLLVQQGTVIPRSRGALRARLAVSLVKGLLRAELTSAAEGVPADMTAVRAALARGRAWVALDDGTLGQVSRELLDLLRETEDMAGGEIERAELGLHQLGRVDRWTEAGSAAGEVTVDASLDTLRTRLRALAVSPEPVLPAGLTATLRPYQRAGLAWLQFLGALGTGGVLADDMGLGKTITTLALVAGRAERDGRAPTLVVCPTSVVGTWLLEAQRFVPGLRVLSLHDPRGWAADDLAAIDLAVTTYALLRRDIAALETVVFRYVILDEAQGVKNADAETSRAARRLHGEGRLALTGTPVENRLGELWAVMDWCNPGVLGSRREFEARYEKPLAASSDPALLARLRATVRPFLLRRTKREVLDDLPPKEEIDLACLLDPVHRAQYDALAAVLRKDIRGRRRSPSAPSPIAVLTALLRLRQMACDPRLVDPSAPPPEGKRTAFLTRVRALAAEGRRALVFSQFVGLLTLWRRDLDAEGIGYSYLDGATSDRDAAVTAFQQGTQALFLISLKAGGTGLNLTAADTVILCDPWWNPAVEDQAADRAHRIGQSRAVTVYRLVASGTVEERVMTLKARKRALADAVVAGDAGALRGITAADLDLLMSAMDGLVD